MKAIILSLFITATALAVEGIPRLTSEQVASAAYTLKGRAVALVNPRPERREISATETKVELGNDLYCILPTGSVPAIDPSRVLYVVITEISGTRLRVAIMGNTASLDIYKRPRFAWVRNGDR